MAARFTSASGALGSSVKAVAPVSEVGILAASRAAAMTWAAW